VRYGHNICSSWPYENIARAAVETTYLRYAKCHHSGDDKEADQAYAMSSSSKANGGRTMMTVSILLSGRLKIDGYGQGHPMNDDSTFRLALREGSTVRDVISGMGVPSERVTMTMINGHSCKAEVDVKPGDRVILIPEDVAILWRDLTLQNLDIGIGFDS